MRTQPETRARSSQEPGKRARKLSRYKANQACTTPARTCLTSLFGWEAVSQADMAALINCREKQYSYPTELKNALKPPPVDIGVGL